MICDMAFIRKHYSILCTGLLLVAACVQPTGAEPIDQTPRPVVRDASGRTLPSLFAGLEITPRGEYFLAQWQARQNGQYPTPSPCTQVPQALGSSATLGHPSELEIGSYLPHMPGVDGRGPSTAERMKLDSLPRAYDVGDCQGHCQKIDKYFCSIFCDRHEFCYNDGCQFSVWQRGCECEDNGCEYNSCEDCSLCPNYN